MEWSYLSLRNILHKNINRYLFLPGTAMPIRERTTCVIAFFAACDDSKLLEKDNEGNVCVVFF